MAQPASRFPRKGPLARSQPPVRMTPGWPPGERAVPLELVQLVAPYRDYGRLLLRIERVPQRARLSRGRNNGDNSWTLASDELDGLRFYPPEGEADLAHSLSIRIMGVDGTVAASTLAVLDYEVPVSEAGSAEPDETTPTPTDIPVIAQDAKLSRLESELEKMRAILSAHETALSSADQRYGAAASEVSRQAIERELERARTVWTVEQERKLAEASATAATVSRQSVERELERARSAWTAEQERKLAEASATAAAVSRQAVERELAKARNAWNSEHDRKLAEASASAAADLERSRDKWQAELDARLAATEEHARKELAESRERWRQEMQVALSRAERAWKADEAARVSAKESEWRTKAGADSALAQAHTDEVSARERAEAELARVREKLSEALAAVADRESHLAQVALETGRDRERLIAERELALRDAQRTWKAEDDRRFADAEARWREESANLSAELSARCERAEAALQNAREESRESNSRALTDAETARERALRDLSEAKVQLSVLKKGLLDRESEVSRLAQAAEKARERAKLESDVLLERAQTAWRSEAAARLASAKAAWRQESAEALASARSETDSSREQHTAELRELQGALAGTQAQLTDRNAELARTRTEAQEAQERLHQEANMQLASAQRAWRAEEAARLSAARAEWNKSTASSLAEATARYQAAETALARMRAKAEEELRLGTREDDDREHLRQQIVLLKAALDKSELELARAHYQAQPVYDMRLTNEFANQSLSGGLSDDAAHEGYERDVEPHAPLFSRGLVRDAVVIFFVVIFTVCVFPFVVPYLPYEWQYQIAVWESEILPPPKATATVPQASTHKVQPAPAPLPSEIVNRASNLHSDAALTSSVIGTVAAGVKVTILGQQGVFTQVRTVPGPGDTPATGWILSSHLAQGDPKSVANP